MFFKNCSLKNSLWSSKWFFYCIIFKIVGFYFLLSCTFSCFLFSFTHSHTALSKHTHSVFLCCLSPKFGSSICVVSKVLVWSGSQFAVLGLKSIWSVQTASDVCVLCRSGARWICVIVSSLKFSATQIVFRWL